MDTTTKGTRTKYRLAEAMKECMKTTPVDNITVTQLTELCGVTRQTFYRNFIDKYDLINWYLYNYSSNFPHFIGFPACPLVK